MAYIRHNINNEVVSPQPSGTTVNQFSGTEGWSTVTYVDLNGDYVPRNHDNTVRTPGTYQARNYDNTTRVPSQYQRHDENNNPILG
jgi:hypothetical protein